MCQCFRISYIAWPVGPFQSRKKCVLLVVCGIFQEVPSARFPQSLRLQDLRFDSLRRVFEVAVPKLLMFVDHEPNRMLIPGAYGHRLRNEKRTYKAHQIRFQSFWSLVFRKDNFDLC